MELTLTHIKKAFSKYNAMYFNNELHTPIFELFKSKKAFGQFCVQNRFSDTPTIKIRISNYYKREERDYDDTIIHEMIHLYIYQYRIKDNSSHGKYWLRIANIINKDGWNIQPRNNTNYEVAVKRNEEYCIFSFLDSTNNRFICRVHPTKREFFVKVFRYNKISNITCIISKDTNKFDRFVNCKSQLRGKYITQQEWEYYSNGENCVLY
ncbi:SprT-like domain-containing protein [bacterium]|nr:SprT-like domain-containing protein [bacterium]